VLCALRAEHDELADAVGVDAPFVVGVLVRPRFPAALLAAIAPPPKVPHVEAGPVSSARTGERSSTGQKLRSGHRTSRLPLVKKDPGRFALAQRAMSCRSYGIRLGSDRWWVSRVRLPWPPATESADAPHRADAREDGPKLFCPGTRFISEGISFTS
jgi:hypothetical protein